MGDENGNLNYEKYYPSKQFQLLWVKEYLKETKSLHQLNEELTNAEVSSLQMRT